MPRSFTNLAALVVLGTASIAPRARADDLHGRDDDVVFPALRFSWLIYRPEMKGLIPLPALGSADRQAPAEDGEKPIVVEPRSDLARDIALSLAVDLDFSFGLGRSTQALASGQSVSFEELDANGPTNLEHEFDLFAWSVAARGGFWTDGFIGIEGFGGLGFGYLDIRSSSGSVHADDQDLYVGPIFGVEGSLNVLPWAGIFGRASIIAGFAEDPFSLGVAEAGLSLAPSPKYTFFAGWKWVDLEVDRRGSDFDLGLSGPVLGLQVNL